MKMLLKLIKWALIIGITLVVAGIVYLAYMGFFSELKVYEKETGPYTIAYEKFVGPYKETGKVFQRLDSSLEADGIKTFRGIGIYYDDPNVTPSDKLRSDNGCVIEDKDLSRIESLKKKYNIKTVKRRYSVVTEFKITGPLSFIMGPVKGYPALMRYVKDKGLKWAKDAMPIEYYDFPSKKICYMIGVEKGAL